MINKNILRSVNLVLRLLDNRVKVIGLVVFMVLSAVLELIGVFSIAPFLLAVTSPQKLMNIPVVGSLISAQELSGGALVITIGMFFITVNTLVNMLIVSGQAVYARFSYGLGAELSGKIFKASVNSESTLALHRDVAKMAVLVVHEPNQVAQDFVAPFLKVISRLIVVFALMVAVLILYSWVALVAILLLGAVYIIIFRSLRKRVGKFGRKSADLNFQKTALVIDAFSSLRELRIWSLEKTFLDRYNEYAVSWSKSQATLSFMSLFPYYMVESLVFSLAILFVTWMYFTHDGITNALPSIGLMLFAGYKIMPALQQSYNALIQMKGAEAVFLRLAKNLEGVDEYQVDEQKKEQLSSLAFSSVIPETQGNSSLSPTSFHVNKGELVAVVGPSGIGKSSLFDALMGFRPYDGDILVNGVVVDRSGILGLRKNLSLVTQTPHMFNMTVKENIILNEVCCESRLAKVVRQARLQDFLSKKHDGLDFLVESAGKNISGGEAQRIAIARCLYRSNDVLLFDEPTSALDSVNAEEFISLLGMLKKDRLIIFVTHDRLLEAHADKVIRL